MIPQEDFFAYLRDGKLRQAKGPIAIILIEDDAALSETLSHHLRIGFPIILALSPSPLPKSELPQGEAGRIVSLRYDARQSDAHIAAVNAVIQAAPENTWLYYCYNAEFLFYPFAETRTVGEMLAFHAEERRRAMLSYVIDLYAPDLSRFPNAVAPADAMFDSKGYYALGRRNRSGGFHERQLDFFGGLRWRYEEHLPSDRRRIDRISLFRTTDGLRAMPGHRFNIEEYNTYSCPWHHNLTAAIPSFRVAKALASNPGSRQVIRDFTWRNSQPFQWNSHQLMDLGLMEPGQWF